MYAIQVNIAYTDEEWHRSHQVPTFYLDENVQGILDETAARDVALRIVDPLLRLASEGAHLYCTAVKL